MKKTIIFLLLLPIFAFAKDTKTKFYDFDDLLRGRVSRKDEETENRRDDEICFFTMIHIHLCAPPRPVDARRTVSISRKKIKYFFPALRNVYCTRLC